MKWVEIKNKVIFFTDNVLRINLSNLVEQLYDYEFTKRCSNCKMIRLKCTFKKLCHEKIEKELLAKLVEKLMKETEEILIIFIV